MTDLRASVAPHLPSAVIPAFFCKASTKRFDVRKVARSAWYIVGVVLVLACASLPSRAATYTVTSLADAGSGTLRSAIANATGNDTILFSVTGTITLSTGQLEIDKNLTISGPGASRLAISGNNLTRIFVV